MANIVLNLLCVESVCGNINTKPFQESIDQNISFSPKFNNSEIIKQLWN